MQGSSPLGLACLLLLWSLHSAAASSFKLTLDAGSDATQLWKIELQSQADSSRLLWSWSAAGPDDGCGDTGSRTDGWFEANEQRSYDIPAASAYYMRLSTGIYYNGDMNTMRYRLDDADSNELIPWTKVNAIARNSECNRGRLDFGSQWYRPFGIEDYLPFGSQSRSGVASYALPAPGSTLPPKGSTTPGSSWPPSSYTPSTMLATTTTTTTTLPEAMCAMRRMHCPIPEQYKKANYVIMGNENATGTCQATEEDGNAFFDFSVEDCNATVLVRDDGHEQYTARLVPHIGFGGVVFVEWPDIVCFCEVDIEGNVVAVALEVEDNDDEATMAGYSAFEPKMVMYPDISFARPMESVDGQSGSGYIVSSERFFLGISSNSTADIIGVQSCTATPLDPAMAQFQQTLWEASCPQDPFDMKLHEYAPTNEVHASLLAFKFAGVEEVSLACTIIRCASEPCGVCEGSNSRRLQLPEAARRLQPPIKVEATVSQTLRLSVKPGSHALALPTVISPADFKVIHESKRDFKAVAFVSSIKVFNVVASRDKKYVELMAQALEAWLDVPGVTLTVWEISVASFQDPEAKLRRLQGSFFASGAADAVELKFDMVPTEQAAGRIEDELARLEALYSMREANALKVALNKELSEVTGKKMAILEVFKGLVMQRQIEDEGSSPALAQQDADHDSFHLTEPVTIVAACAGLGFGLFIAFSCQAAVRSCRHRTTAEKLPQGTPPRSRAGQHGGDFSTPVVAWDAVMFGDPCSPRLLGAQLSPKGGDLVDSRRGSK